MGGRKGSEMCSFKTRKTPLSPFKPSTGRYQLLASAHSSNNMLTDRCSYEFNGRAIKVRQDRNSTGAGISTQSVSSSNQIGYGPGTMGPDGFQSRNDRQPGAALRQAIHLRTDRVLDEQADPLSNIGNGLGSSPKRVVQEDPRNPVTAGIRRGQIGSNVTPSSGAPSGRFRNASHPGRIIMPSFNGFGQVNPLSPVQPRGMPPMTPSVSGPASSFCGAKI